MINSTNPALVQDCRFQSNRAEQFGGAIYICAGAQANIRGTEFSNNFAEEGGALATSFDVKLNLQNNKFVKNIATSLGGAISFTGDSKNIVDTEYVQRDSVFHENWAGQSGGASYWHASTMTTDQPCFGCTYNLNMAGHYGSNEASDVTSVIVPVSSQYVFYPGIGSTNSSFYLNLVDYFGQTVHSSSGTGVLHMFRK